MAIINGCETAKASFTYWNDPANITNWDATIQYSFNLGTFSNGITNNRIVTNGGGSLRSKTEILWADAGGAIGGVIEGAFIGAAAGPSGAMIVGMTGMVLRGAQASLGAYATRKVLDWLDAHFW